MLLLRRTALVALPKRFLMTQIRLALMLYFIVAHKAACQTVECLLEIYEGMVEVVLVMEIFHTEDS